MNTRMTTGRIANTRLRWVLAFAAAWAIVFCMSLAAGVTPAYASDAQGPSGEGVVAAPVASAGQQGSIGAASISDPSATSPETSSHNDASNLATGGNAPDDGASTEPPAQGGGELSASGDLSAAYSTNNPADDGTSDVFINLRADYVLGPNGFSDLSYGESWGYDPDSCYVPVNQGDGVDVGVFIDYARVGNTSSYSSFSLPMPELTDASTSQNLNDYFMVNWYDGETPLPQGTYYSDLAEYQRVTGSDSAGGAAQLPAYGEYPINAMAFIWSSASQGFDSGHGWEFFDIPNRIGYEPCYGISGAAGTCTINFPARGQMWASNSPVLFFEGSGRRVITAQVTLVREYIDPRDGENGPYNYVSHIVHASRPVVFVFDIAPVATATLLVDAEDDSGNAVNIEGNDDFIIAIYKKYKNFDDTMMDDLPYGPDVYGGGTHGTNYAGAWWQNARLYNATPGIYKVLVTHKHGLYEDFTGTIEVTERDVASGGLVTKTLPLKSVSQIKQHSVKFVDEDGNLISPPGEQLYNENTLWSVVTRPSTTPVTSQPETDDYKYVFWSWKAKEGSYGDKVVEDTVLEPYFKKVPKKSKPVTPRVYASGGLFGRPMPAGVSAYELTAAPLDPTTSASAAAMIANHSATIGDSQVLGMFEVGITQYNDDGTTASVTEGVGDLNLSFKLDGVADGTKVKVLQIHETGDPENPEKEIMHTGLTVVNGEVGVTLNDELSTFIILEDAANYGDDGSEAISIGIIPVPTNVPVYGADPSDPTAVNPFAPPVVDANGTMNVYIDIARGEAIDLGVSVDYLRMGNQTYESGQNVTLPAAITGDSTSQRASDYFMVSWYHGETPLPQGTYYSDLAAYQGANPGSTGGQPMPSYGSYDISPMLYIYQSAFYGYDNGDGKGVTYYQFPDPYYRSWYSTSPSMQWSADGKTLSVGENHYIMANAFPQLYFPYNDSNIVITAQATYVEEFIETRTDEGGNPYNFVTHVVHASNPIVFHIVIRPTVSASLEINIVDENGDPVAIDVWSPYSSNFDVELDKKYKDFDDTSGDAALHHYDTRNYVNVSGSLRYDDVATAGFYKFGIANTVGLYEPLVTTFELTEQEVQEAYANHTSIVKTFQIKSVAPETYNVTFVDYDDTNLLGPTPYNANTYGGVVVWPSPLPKNKPEDADYKYVFQCWENVEGGYQVPEIEAVTRDVTYRAVYKAIPKVNNPVTPRVYASGGLFGKVKPSGVSSYQLVANPLDPSTDANAAVTVAKYSAEIGNSKVVGMFEVGITQHNDDGTTESVTTGVGDMKLNFILDGVADGTKVKVLQIHETGDRENPEKLIVHTGLTVVNGEVGVTLNDELSTFVILEDLEAQGGDEGDGDGNDGGDGDGNGQNDDVDIEPSNPSSGGSSGTPAGGETPEAETPAVEDPKAEAPSADTPAASDPVSESPKAETPASSASDDGKDFIDGEESADEPATRAMPADDSKVGEGGLADDGRGEDAPEVVKAGPSADGGKTMPQTGDAAQPLSSALIALLLMAVAGAACAAARAAKHQLAPKK